MRDPTDNNGDPAWPVIYRLANHPMTDLMEAATVYFAGSLNVAPPAVVLATGDEDSYMAASKAGTGNQAAPLPEDILPGAPIVMAFSWAGPGSVFVIGDSDLWSDDDTDGDGTPNLNYDNRRLARNVLDYPWCRRAGCHRILFDETHGWASDWSVGVYTIEGIFAELAALLRSSGHRVDSLRDPAPLDAAALLPYDVLVLVLPQETYSADEKAAIAGFVAGGGRLVTISDRGPFAGASVGILNDIHT